MRTKACQINVKEFEFSAKKNIPYSGMFVGPQGLEP